MFAAVLSIEGYQIRVNGVPTVIPKELAIVHYGSREFECFFFKPPAGLQLSPIDLKTTQWCFKHLHGLRFGEGSIPYTALGEIMKTLENVHVVVHGSTTASFAREWLPTSRITDTSTLGHQLPAAILKKDCGRQHKTARHCALSKAFHVMENFKI